MPHGIFRVPSFFPGLLHWIYITNLYHKSAQCFFFAVFQNFRNKKKVFLVILGWSRLFCLNPIDAEFNTLISLNTLFHSFIQKFLQNVRFNLFFDWWQNRNFSVREVIKKFGQCCGSNPPNQTIHRAP